MSYGKNLLIALDQLVNTLFGGWADETLSSRCHRWRIAGIAWPAKIVNALFFWQDDHCQSAYDSERYGRQLPPELR